MRESTEPFRVRAARPDDLARLEAVERSAAGLFRELSVLAEHQRRGLGSALLRRAIEHARQAGCFAVILNTYRDIPWNAPFYARRGFVEIAGAAVPPALREKLARDALHGHDPARRCGMILRLAPA